MDTQSLTISRFSVLSDPESIALESLEEGTGHFVFDDEMLYLLARRGLVESDGERWQITEQGQRKLSERG